MAAVRERLTRRTDSAPARSRWLVAGAVVALAIALGFEFAVGRQGGVRAGRWPLFATYAGWWVAFVAGAVCLRRTPRRAALGLLAGGTLALHLVGLAAGPQLSDDLYRYAWDGKVQAAGIDPYRYPPASSHLGFLHDPWLWPGPADCATRGEPPGCTPINRPHDRTIYPPVAEGWFWLLHEVTPAGAQTLALQAPAAVIDLAVVGLIVAVLRALGRDDRLAAWYAWSPIAVGETAMEAHVDVLAIFAAVAALWVLHRRRPALGGALVAVATLIKVYPLLLAPVALRRRPWLAGAALVGMCGLAYLPHVLAVGPEVVGFLPGYLQEEGYSQGSRFLLVGLLGLTGTPAKVAVAAGLAAVAIWVLRDRAARVETAALRMVGAAFLLATPVQPWYALLLVAVAVLAGRPEWLGVAFAGYALYFAVLDGPDALLIGRVAYGLAALLVAVVAVWRWRARSPGDGVPAAVTP